MFVQVVSGASGMACEPSAVGGTVVGMSEATVSVPVCVPTARTQICP